MIRNCGKEKVEHWDFISSPFRLSISDEFVLKHAVISRRDFLHFTDKADFLLLRVFLFVCTVSINKRKSNNEIDGHRQENWKRAHHNKAYSLCCSNSVLSEQEANKTFNGRRIL